MAQNTAPIFELVPTVAPQTFASGDTSTVKDVQTGGTNGTRIDSIMCSSNDTAAVNLAFYIYVGATAYYIGNVLVPVGAGYTTVARVDAMATLSPGLGYLVLPSGAKLQANCVATMTAAKIATVVAMGGDY